MYDFNLLKNSRLNTEFAEMQLLAEQRERLAAVKPYQGLTILQNVPMTISTAFKIEALALAGAEVVSFVSDIIPPDPQAIDLLQRANFVMVDSVADLEQFDLHLDCCAELLAAKPPRLGAVELTQSGSNLYHQAMTSYPVVSVDDSKLKVLETFLGTGDGLSRALDARLGSDKNAKPYVVFGYGKVGKGIVYALQKFTNDIIVIEMANKHGTSKPGLQFVDAGDATAVSAALAQAFVVITATGVRNLLTTQYSLTPHAMPNALLINMGAEDEYGANFSADAVENAKKPFNFSLQMPTALRYLDPIFVAHNASIDLILTNSVNSGYNPYPDHLATELITKWQDIYQESIAEALLSFE